jgi:Rad3-related DNA helicase
MASSAGQMISLANFDPCELGFDAEKFPSFRNEQIEAIEQIANGEKRFQALCVPTGGGKSLIAAGAAKATGLKTVILTATKGLQQQYMDDFESVGMRDIRGKSNYQCADRDVSCRFGAMEGCRLTNRNGCVYECARDVAVASDLVVTNYAYWLRANERRKLGQELWSDSMELLICDEGHAAMQQLSGAIQVTLRESWLREAGYKFKATDDLGEWAGYAAARGEDIKVDLKESIKELQRKPTEKIRKRVLQLEELDQALEKIWSMSNDGWVCEMREGRVGQINARVWEFDCLWPGAWAEGKLFCGVPKVVLMSATLRPASMGMLGVGKGEFEYREWDRVFPAQNTPVYHVPTVRMNWRTGEEDLRRWVERIDEIIESRLERKGIIHTVSYARQQYLLSHSRFAGDMLANTNEPDSEAAVGICGQFKERTAPVILVSPSFSTGWDFPGRDCLAPETRLLTADLKWVSVGLLKIGDKLVGFDESVQKGRRGRTWKECIVTENSRSILDCRRIILENGREVICSSNHKWLVQRSGKAEWVSAKELFCGPRNFSYLSEVCSVWEPGKDRESGYLAAAFDGEGYLTQNRNNWNRSMGEMPNVSMGFHQVENHMLSTVVEMLIEKGFLAKSYRSERAKPHHQDKVTLQITNRRDIMRFLGEMRPARLLPKFKVNNFGSLRSTPIKVVANEKIGSQEVVVLGTTTKTFVAEGFASHNCEFQIIAKVPYPYSKTKVMKARMERSPRYSDYLAMQDLIQACGRGTRFAEDRCELFIVDDSITWFMKTNKGMAPRWFEVIPVNKVPAPGPRAPLGKGVAPDWPKGSEFQLSDGKLEW